MVVAAVVATELMVVQAEVLVVVVVWLATSPHMEVLKTKQILAVVQVLAATAAITLIIRIRLLVAAVVQVALVGPQEVLLHIAVGRQLVATEVPVKIIVQNLEQVLVILVGLPAAVVVWAAVFMVGYTVTEMVEVPVRAAAAMVAHLEVEPTKDKQLMQ